MIRTLTVLGAGTMGHGIAYAAVSAGYETRLYDPSPAQLQKAQAAVRAILEKGVELGKASAADADAAAARLQVTSETAAALAGTDFVIEQIQTSPCETADSLLAATDTLICLPASDIVTGTLITPVPLSVLPIALSMPARSLPMTCVEPLTTTCGV